MWPGMLSYTSYKYNYRAGPVMFGLLALGGDIGCSAGPWVTGKVSDMYLAFTQTGTVENLSNQAIKTGLLAAIVFPCAMLVLLLIMKKLKNTEIT